MTQMVGSFVTEYLCVFATALRGNTRARIGAMRGTRPKGLLTYGPCQRSFVTPCVWIEVGLVYTHDFTFCRISLYFRLRSLRFKGSFVIPKLTSLVMGSIWASGVTNLQTNTQQPRQFHLIMIKPSHYDDDGYVIQWVRSSIPSNTLAVLNGLAVDCVERKVLGDDVEIKLTTFDETNTRIKLAKIIAKIRGAGMSGLVAFVGVQSNQFPRTMDMARRLRSADIQVCIGGFHPSGCIAMLPKLPADLQEAVDLGISLFAGESEGRLDDVLQDAFRHDLKPIYNYMNDLPGLEGAVTPLLPSERVRRVAGGHTSFDSGRGCPFQCSFCTIINVQGRKSRYRSGEDIERIIRANIEQGIHSFFITDDNFARNKNWEKILDRLIDLRENEGLGMKFIIQVDTLCHTLPNFVEKCRRAGVRRVFIGLENINPENLLAVGKKQNRISEYKTMLQAWKRAHVVTYCGYIVGLPGDTPETVVRDVGIIQRELAIDLVEFNVLTPLPGSKDHQFLDSAGIWMDPDMNKYDLEHITTGHPKMTAEEWRRCYDLAWETYYSEAHIETLMRRARACGMSVGNMLFYCVWFAGCKKFEGVHPLQGGFFRRKYRRDRRSNLPRENPLVFYPKYFSHIFRSQYGFLSLALRLRKIRNRIKSDPAAYDYVDAALSDDDGGEFGPPVLQRAS